MAAKSTTPNKRQQLQAQRQREAAQRKRLITVFVGLLVLVLVVAVIVIWQVTSRPSDPATTPGTTASDGTFIPPNGTAEMGWITVTSPNPKPDAVIVGEHTDYQCPWCGLTDAIFGAQLETLAQRGDIILQYHIRTLIGDQLIKNDSSWRAAMAATCADVVGHFPAYHETVFANQPDVEGTGYTDAQLRVDFAAQAGITGANLTAFQACYDSKQTLDYVHGMEQVNFNSRTINGPDQAPVTGTPVFFVNGYKLELNNLIAQDPTTGAWGSVIGDTPDELLTFLQNWRGGPTGG